MGRWHSPTCCSRASRSTLAASRSAPLPPYAPPTPCPILTQRIMLSAYVPPTPCPVLIYGIVVPDRRQPPRYLRDPVSPTSPHPHAITSLPFRPHITSPLLLSHLHITRRKHLSLSPCLSLALFLEREKRPERERWVTPCADNEPSRKWLDDSDPSRILAP
eukprot:3895116-Rhodomonas_salina.1